MRPTPVRFRIASVCLVTSLLAAACSGAGDAGAADGPAGLDGPDYVIDPQPTDVYTVGALEGEPWETFGNVSRVAFDSEGNLYILDTGAAHIVVMSPTGEHVRNISQKGDGPGELGNPFGFVITADDRVVVYDFAKQGFQVFTRDGDFVESIPIDPQEGIPGREMRPLPSGKIVSGGGFRIAMSRDGGIETPPPGRPVDVFGLDGSHESLYTAWEMPATGETDETSFSTGKGSNISLQMQQLRAFEPGLAVDVLPDGRVAVVDSIGYRVKLVDATGAVTGTLERPIPAVDVDETIREQERARRLSELEEGSGGGATMMVIGRQSGGGGSMSIDQEQIRRMREDAIAGMAFAPYIPVIEDMAADPEGRLWIQRSGPEPGVDGPTDIVTPDGGYFGTIPATGLRIPDAFGPDGLIAYIEEDELEVQRVRVARLPALEALESGA